MTLVPFPRTKLLFSTVALLPGIGLGAGGSHWSGHSVTDSSGRQYTVSLPSRFALNHQRTTLCDQYVYCSAAGEAVHVSISIASPRARQALNAMVRDDRCHRRPSSDFVCCRYSVHVSCEESGLATYRALGETVLVPNGRGLPCIALTYFSETNTVETSMVMRRVACEFAGGNR